MNSTDFQFTNTGGVRCHVLRPWNPPLNEFCWTVVERPTNVCPRSAVRCQCNQLHWSDFPLQHILEIAVKRGRGNLFKNLFCKFTPESPHPFDLVHLSKSKESCECFSRYSDKRLRFFNDFYLLERTENIWVMYNYYAILGQWNFSFFHIPGRIKTSKMTFYMSYAFVG